MRLAQLGMFAITAAIAACTSVRPDPRIVVDTPASFSHDLLDRVLVEFVDDQGRVDYRRLADQRGDLDRYFALVAAIGPDNHPELFPTREQRLAYWMNAYNAAVITAVLESYPIESVGDVGLPTMKAGFFLLQRIPIGGKTTNLYELENSVIRDRFHEPRIHFAINCASASCPKLPRHAFDANRLEAQLDEAARLFVSEPRNVRIDHDARTVHLSAIFDWYESDFVEWPADRLPDSPTLLDYVSLHAAQPLRDQLRRAADYDIEFNRYDWSLNDQQPGRVRSLAVRSVEKVG